MRGWRFLDTGEGDGTTNMAVDVALAKTLQDAGPDDSGRQILDRLSLDGPPLPTVRFYRWHPWAVSVGYNQGSEDLDPAAIERAGYHIVRRPTGGRAILHAEELTYSVVQFAGGRGVLDVYNDISRALVAGLRRFGVEASLQRVQPNLSREYRNPSSVPCFTRSARYEIEWRGRKLVGSAQRRFGDGGRDVVLQHGSLLCGPAHRGLADLLRVDTSTQEIIRRELNEKTVDVGEILQRPVDLDALAACLREGFEEAWGITFEHTVSAGTP